MFSQIFLFEIRYRLRRPAFYVYFAVVLIFTTLFLAKGDVGSAEKEAINSPVQIADFFSGICLFLLLVSSAIMGTPLYRDLEHNTKEYYLSYPITKAGYFWGRFLGSFFFVLLISFCLVIGAWFGTALGPVFGWNAATRYGPNNLSAYITPWLIIVVPTIFFTSAFFFGLVAIFRNVKVIYSSGMFFFLGYILADFGLHTIHNDKLIYLADPFLINGIRLATGGFSSDQRNHYLISLNGLLLYNRILWFATGALVMVFTWWRFTFERFFSGRASKDKTVAKTSFVPTLVRPHIELRGSYYRRTLFSLTRIELLNIIRDNYFWIILSGGYIFLIFVFSHGPGRWDVHDYPRTVFFVDAFTDIFIFFIFLIIVFYTGETVNREKLTRFAFINDALPPPDWLFNTAKILSLCILAVFLALTPAIIGLPIQLIKGYTHFNLSQYVSSTFIAILPKLINMVLFCYAVHLITNNKFAGHGIAISIWIVMFCVVAFNYFNYFPLLYSYTTPIWASDMDGIGHMAGPISWFNSYWTVAGLLLVVIGGLFFARGVPRSAGERLRLARERFHGPARTGAIAIFIAFIALGAWVYYNVSYLNGYLTPWERNERKALVEKQLKHFSSLPIPHITRLTMNVDLFPDRQREETHATITVMNTGSRRIDTLLVDGDGLEFEISYEGRVLPYTCPLYYPQGKFNAFRPAREASDYRLYILPAPLQPGDSARFQLHSTLAFHGFQNGLFAAGALRNGMIMADNLPGLGYDEEDELGAGDVRKTHGLPEKKWVDVPWNDSVGRYSLFSGVNAGLIPYDLTVSTGIDQWVQASGHLEKEWTDRGRRYFHFRQEQPGVYPPTVIASARYARWNDTVRLDNGRTIAVGIDYHPEHSTNLKHFQQAIKDALRYFSNAYGTYPYDQLTLVESPAYSRNEHATPGVIYLPEQQGWVADMRDHESWDYPYYVVAHLVAQQWWGVTAAPNGTVGAQVISSGIPRYAALTLLAQRRDSNDYRRGWQFVEWDYGWGRRTDFEGERPLINANKWYEWESRTALLLHTLDRSIGTDSVNAALRDLYGRWALRKTGPYPGAHDLYDVLEAHIPDSLKGWFAGEWQKAPAGPPASPGTRSITAATH
jgi:ABC-2 type transport system permease protein